MHISIISPTKAYITGYTQSELFKIREALSFSNTGILFQIKKHRERQWLKKKDIDAWQQQLDKLTSQLNTTLLFQDDGGYWIRPGSIPYLPSMPITIENKVTYPTGRALPWAKKLEFELYPYQKEAIDKLIMAKHGNIAYATGTGKTLILLGIAQRMGLSAVITTPSQSIFNELLNEFTLRLGRGVVGGYGDGKKDTKKAITIAIGKSLTMLKPGTNAYDFFAKKQLMAVDESHTFSSETLENCCHGVLKDVPYRMFVSATQVRNDGGIALLQSIIGQQMSELSLEDAINGGYLCPLQFKILSVISPSTVYKKDPLECKRVHFLHNPKIIELAAKIANSAWEVKQESTLILVEELSQISALIKQLKVPFGYVHSGSKADAEQWGLTTVDLQEQVDKFNRGEIKVLCGTRAISVGSNIYPTNNSVNLMGGSSEIVTKQGAMGRSTRKLELSKYAQFHKPKPICTIYDFRVMGQPILESQLKKRLEYYSESGGEISFF